MLRLSKDDVVNLCGAPDGIRLYNLAHNIQIKPKLSIFVTFQEDTFYSAVFLSEWKAEYLIRKIIAAYFGFFRSPTAAKQTAAMAVAVATVDEETCENQQQIMLVNKRNDSHGIVYKELMSDLYEYELLLKVKGIFVRTTDEVLNNLQDQSKFYVSFEMPSGNLGTDGGGGRMKAGNLVKIVMIPLD